MNDSRVIRPGELGGYGIDAQWCDDFHHAIHTLLTGERQGYYVDFGKMEHLVKSFNESFVYSGQYSEYRKRNHGNSSKDIPARRFIVFSQNHDQIGNRMLGERLSTLVSFEALKLAAGAVLLSPYIPLLFMGEEYGEGSPFLYFVSFSDSDLVDAVRKGRKEEFRAFEWQGELPDPQSVETFHKSKIEWGKRYKGTHRVLLDFYKTVISLRRKTPALSNPDKDHLDVREFEDKEILCMRRWRDGSEVFWIANFNKDDMSITVPLSPGTWKKILDSSEDIWGGTGSLLPETMTQGEELIIRGLSGALYMREKIR